jgi:hypothetical protein
MAAPQTQPNPLRKALGKLPGSQAAKVAPLPSVDSPIGRVPVLPVIILGIGAYLVWYGIHYWDSDSKYPTDPLKSILTGKGLPAATGQTPAAAVTAAEEGGSSSGTPSGGNVTASGIATQAQLYDNNVNNPKMYVWGGAPGTTKGQLAGTDCSGFVNAVIGRDLGCQIPGYKAGAYSGSVHGPAVSDWSATDECTDTSTPAAGDIVCYGTDHMGIMTSASDYISDTDPTSGIITQPAATGGPGGLTPKYRSLKPTALAGGGSGAGSADPSQATIGPSTTNGAIVYSFLRSSGYSQMAAAGAISSMYFESIGWDFEAKNPTSTAAGVMQWLSTSPGYTELTGSAVNDAPGQLQGILTYVAQTSPGIVALMGAASTVQDAGALWESQIEISGVTPNDGWTQAAAVAKSTDGADLQAS